MKRLIGIILALCVAMGSFGIAYAKDYEDITSETVREATDILSDMGIITGYDDDTFRADNNITRAEFAVIIARMRRMNENSERERTYYYDVPSDHWAAGSINQLSQNGIVSGYGEGIFGVDKNVTVQEAYKMLLSMLGYGPAAEAEGGYPEGYIKNASSSGLNDNIPAGSTDNLTRGQAAVLVYNALDIKLWTQNSQGKLEKSNTTFAENYWNIIKVEGTVTEVPGTTLYGSNSFMKYIGIGDEHYETDLDISPELLGKYVVAYYEDIDSGRVLYIHEKTTKTKELVIAAENIDNVTADGAIQYWSSKLSKKTEKIDPKAHVIYNGIAVSEYKFSDFDIDYGSIRFLQTSGSGKYDIVFIDTYYDMHVSSIDTNNYTVYSTLGGSLKIEESDFERLVIRDTDGRELTFNDIAADDVLSVRLSGNVYAQITVCRNVVSGIMGTIGYDDDETIVSIDDEQYKVYKPYGESFRNSFKAGSTVTAYFDAQGNLVYCKTGDTGRDPIGYIVKGWIDESGEDLILKIFTYEGEMKELKVSPKAKLDGEQYSSSDRIFRELSENDYSVDRQLIVYKLNSSGEISYIDTVKQGAKENEYTLSVSMPLASYRIKANGALGGKGYIKGTTNMVCVPADEDIAKSSDSDYEIRPASSIMTNVYRSLETYKLAPKIGYESIVVMKGGKSNGIGELDQCAIVKRVRETVTPDGDITKSIEYVSPSGEFEKIVDPDSLPVIGSIEKGDLIRVGLNSADMIDTVEFVIRNGWKPTMGSGYFYDSLNSVDVEQKYTYGYAAEKEGSILRISYDGTNKWDEVANITSCIIYNTDNGDITFGSINDILTAEDVGDACDNVFIQWHYSDILCCVIYK